MKVRVDVYTKDVDAALAAYKKALDEGATDISLRSSEDYETKQFEYLNFEFEADHTSEAVAQLDDGPFAKDYDDL